MLLIVGLGNPGKKYEFTWHNLGWLVLDELQKQSAESTPFQLKEKFKAEISICKDADNEVMLIKPQTFMNLSGQSVQAIASFYKIEPDQIWVIHDEIDLPLGTLRVSRNASAGGHNGVQSIIDLLGTKEFVRFRVGCATDEKKVIPTEDYVLQKISSTYKKEVAEVIERTVQAITLAANDSVDAAMTKFN
jgi:PTH1 family peptidyl-tRNA hydrolase